MKMNNIELIFDCIRAIIAGLFAGIVIALAFSMAFLKSLPELFNK